MAIAVGSVVRRESSHVPGDTDGMAPVVVWIIVALVTAVVVLVVAGAAGGRATGARDFVGDLRAGLRRDHRTGLLRGLREEMAEVAEVESGSVEDIFAVGTPEDRDYVQPREIVQTLGLAAGRPRRTPELAHR